MKPLLGSTDSLQLFPLAYPWAWDMYLECFDNTWSPREIPVAEDVALWRSTTLTEAERHLFLSVMAQLTTFDVQRGDETAESLQGLMDPPEIKHFLKRLAFEEALHTHSYQFIIENMGLDLEDIYSRYSRVPSMAARVDFATALSTRVKRIWAEHLLSGSFDYSLQERQDILTAIIFWFLCFEGIWFIMGLLGPVQNLARQGKFRGAAEQFTFIARDEVQHIRFGTELITEFIAQNPDCWTEEFQSQIQALFRTTVDLEQDYFSYCLPTPILGYGVVPHIKTCEWYANLRARSIGIAEPYPGAEHMFPWMGEQMQIRKEKNFFECRVTEYRAGGALKWDD